MTTWISLGAILYPGDKAPAPVSIAGCNTTSCNNIGTKYTVIDQSYAKCPDIANGIIIQNKAVKFPQDLTFNCTCSKVKNYATFDVNGTLINKYKVHE